MEDSPQVKRLVHRDRVWIREHFDWLNRNFTGYLAQRRLVLPSSEFFPDLPPRDDPDAYAERVFEITKAHMGLSEVKTRLEGYDDAAERTNRAMPDLLSISGDRSAAGLFQMAADEKTVVIQYCRSLTSDFDSLVSTFAHELSHYLLGCAKNDPPAGWNDDEPLTDLTAVFSGFGLFLMNSCVKFAQFSNGKTQGWAMSTQGYLGSPSLGSGLALFLLAKGIQPGIVGEYLGRNGRHDLEEAVLSFTSPQMEEDVARFRSSGLGDRKPQFIPSLKKPFWKELMAVMFGNSGDSRG